MPVRTIECFRTQRATLAASVGTYVARVLVVDLLPAVGSTTDADVAPLDVLFPARTEGW
jgi:hypothetical protein